MSGYTEKITKHIKRQKTISRDRARREPDIAGMLELLDQKFKTTMINMLKDLMNKVDSMQEQIGNVRRKMKILKQTTKKELRKIKNTVTEGRMPLLGLLVEWT